MSEDMYRHANGMWWALHPYARSREFSLHTRDEKKAREKYDRIVRSYDEAMRMNKPFKMFDYRSNEAYRDVRVCWDELERLQAQLKEADDTPAWEALKISKEKLKQAEARAGAAEAYVAELEEFFGKSRTDVLARAEAAEAKVKALEAQLRAFKDYYGEKENLA
jgi:hypothetical protein